MSKKQSIIEQVSNRVTETIFNLIMVEVDPAIKNMIILKISSGLLTAFNAGELEGLRKAEQIFKSLSKE